MSLNPLSYRSVSEEEDMELFLKFIQIGQQDKVAASQLFYSINSQRQLGCLVLGVTIVALAILGCAAGPIVGGVIGVFAIIPLVLFIRIRNQQKVLNQQINAGVIENSAALIALATEITSSNQSRKTEASRALANGGNREELRNKDKERCDKNIQSWKQQIIQPPFLCNHADWTTFLGACAKFQEPALETSE
jgi:hypothetical protein